MESRRRTGRPTLGRVEIALALTLAAVLVVRFGPEVRARTGLPMRAPALELETFAGDTLRLRELRGSVVVVNFWASWCAPCRTELPLLDRIRDEYGGRGLEVVGLSVDEGAIADYVDYLRRAGVDYPLARASPAAVRGLGHGGAVPTTILIARDGRVADYLVGPVEEDALRERLEALLGSR
jgi:thiol-disulfide isomerase/thioredoxin